MLIRLPVLLLLLLLPLLLHAQTNTSGWYEFKPEESSSSSIIDMTTWLDAPAGKHGFVQTDQGRFVFEDGTPVKFWGVNIASGWPFVGRDKGFFTVNTGGTKAVVGFASGRVHQLGEVAVTTSNPFAVIFVSSLEKDKSLSQAKRILITTVARAQNTGMEYSADGTNLLKVGEAPLLMEPVQANLSFNRSGALKIHILDHVGCRTGETIPVKGKNIVLDGKKYKTLYYELEFR